MSSRATIAVDVGGTFTDVVLRAGSRLSSAKVPSTHPDPSIGVIDGVRKALANAGLTSSDVDWIAHATTAATNALLERTGARVVLLVTEGFGDLLTIGRQRRIDPFSLVNERLMPLVERADVIEVAERLDVNGAVVIELTDTAVASVAARVVALAPDAVAVCLVHGHVDSTHELAVEAALRAAGVVCPVFVSHRVLAQPREYERASTTTIAAYLGPLISSYLDRLSDRLGDIGFLDEYMVMKSSGGLIPANEAARHPEELVESGPAAGVIGAKAFGDRVGESDIIAFDMGGTTAKAALIHGGDYSMNYDYEVGGAAHGGSMLAKGTGYPLRTPVIDIAEVGTGGGSIAWVDEAGALRVGPRSAGADPGPACYLRGGTRATVTDAYVHLGLLRPSVGSHLHGIGVEAAADALAALGRELGSTSAETARAILRIATAQMSDAVRIVTVSQGLDPREFVLLASGGAGPLHAWAIAEDLGIKTILIPPMAGVHSAMGLLDAVVQVDESLGLLVRTDDPSAATTVAGAARAVAERAATAVDGPGFEHMFTADLRYPGQSYELNVPLGVAADGSVDLPTAKADFDLAHIRLYGHARPESPCEIITVRVSRRQAAVRVSAADAVEPFAVDHAEREADFGDGSAPTAVMSRSELSGERVGPLVIEEPATSVVVALSWSVTAIDGGGYRLTRQEDLR